MGKPTTVSRAGEMRHRNAMLRSAEKIIYRNAKARHAARIVKGVNGCGDYPFTLQNSCVTANMLEVLYYLLCSGWNPFPDMDAEKYMASSDFAKKMKQLKKARAGKLAAFMDMLNYVKTFKVKNGIFTTAIILVLKSEEFFGLP